MKRTVWILTLVVLVAAPATVAYATHSWGNYHWNGNAPVTVKFRDSVEAKWDPSLLVTLAKWDESPVIDNVLDAGSEKERGRCASPSDTVRICNARYGRTGWLGLTRIWIGAHGHIQTALIKVNDTYFNKDKYGTDNGRLHVMCHELGHAFGLGHRKNGDSCLNTKSGINSPSHTLPDGHDFEQLQRIYAHSASAPTDSTQDGHVSVEQSGKYTVLTHRYPAR